MTDEERALLRANAADEGSPFHKKEPNNFGLTPPTHPRPDKTLCDGAGITDKSVADRLFARAIDVGFVSEAKTAEGFPKQLWVLDDSNQVFEAIYGGSRAGRYHGYPIRLRDPFHAELQRLWRERGHVGS